ncbi:hypothetical protein [Streptomyces sp. ME19-01-6]|uniref:hypothetical protein n=1 Tax=Streptomyces sp. ME19-01-6 TaxID=3028686 RepID=UPI0029B8959A|nr:hypothetical protein [Streptomyces sp. ME19-01-6]MDX3232515.1 hypothetical protein [Streptomyces sp. ME19-01-6]
MKQPAVIKADQALLPQRFPAAPAPSADIVSALQLVPEGALVHLQGLITSVDCTRHNGYCRVTIADKSGTAVVHFRDEVTNGRKDDELKIGRVLAVVGCATPDADYDVRAAAFQTCAFSVALT